MQKKHAKAKTTRLQLKDNTGISDEMQRQLAPVLAKLEEEVSKEEGSGQLVQPPGGGGE